MDFASLKYYFVCNDDWAFCDLSRYVLSSSSAFCFLCLFCFVLVFCSDGVCGKSKLFSFIIGWMYYWFYDFAYCALSNVESEF